MGELHTDYYAVLGVPRDVSDELLRRAYKEQALLHHPDKNRDCVVEATKRFKLIGEAYSVLKDPVLRADYDMKGHASCSVMQTFNFDTAVNLFQSVFGAETIGAVLSGAASCCREIPGVRGVAAAGFESMLAQAELDLNSEMQRLASIDHDVDMRRFEVEEQAKRFMLAEKEHCQLCSLRKRNMEIAGLGVLSLTFACWGAFFTLMTYAFATLVVLWLLSVGYVIECGWALAQLNAAHRERVVEDMRKSGHFQQALFQAQLSLKEQTELVRNTRQRLAQIRGAANEAEMKGPSFQDTLTLGSHLIGKVAGGVSNVFKKRFPPVS